VPFGGYKNLIVGVSNYFGSYCISAFAYENDALGRRTERLDFDDNLFAKTNSFAYNGYSELTNAIMNTDNYNYTFDEIGNREEAQINTTSVDYENSQLNQCLEANSSNPAYDKSFAFDSDGNMLTYSDWTYTWNGENRLVTASNATTVVNFKYDYMGRRFEKSVAGGETTTFIYDGWNPVMEVRSENGEVGNVGTNYYSWGLDLSGSLQGAGGVGGLLSTVQDGNIYFSCFDANGNVTDLVGTNGNSVAHYEYDPFGNTTTKTGTLADANLFRFSSHYFDIEIGLYNGKNRYYNPELGRFVSMDPVDDIGLPERLALGISLSDDSLVEIYSREIANSYRYADNMPVGNIDALGFKTTSSCGPCKNDDVFGLMQDPKWEYDIDGCSLEWWTIPIATDSWDKDNPVGWCSFYAACTAHDKCYQTCDNQTADSRTKDWCDNMFEKNMKRACDRCVARRYYQEGSLRVRMYTSAHIAKERCYAHAKSYAFGVRIKGGEAWKKRQEETCTLCCCP
jgi:RHS repeat-associated protein